MRSAMSFALAAPAAIPHLPNPVAMKMVDVAGWRYLGMVVWPGLFLR
jgi:hypothetical protein